MNETEAIAKANKYVLEDQGVEAKPVEIHLIQRPGTRRYWWVSYGTSIWFPKETAAGAIVDGGEYILRVDDENGEISAFE